MQSIPIPRYQARVPGNEEQEAPPGFPLFYTVRDTPVSATLAGNIIP